MQYVLTFIDEATCFCCIYLLHDKSSSTVVAVLQSWLPFVQNQASSTPKWLCTDRGREYLGLENVTRFLYEHGIAHEQTAAHSSASNGVAERMNRTFFDIIRSIIIDCVMPTPFWGDAICAACEIHNRLLSRSINNISPHQLWFGNAPTFKALHRFSCLTYAHTLSTPMGAKVDPVESIVAFYATLIYRRGFSCFGTSNVDARYNSEMSDS
jgi:transposase InsO family protein